MWEWIEYPSWGNFGVTVALDMWGLGMTADLNGDPHIFTLWLGPVQLWAAW